jgi:hypothetical protein
MLNEEKCFYEVKVKVLNSSGKIVKRTRKVKADNPGHAARKVKELYEKSGKFYEIDSCMKYEEDILNEEEPLKESTMKITKSKLKQIIKEEIEKVQEEMSSDFDKCEVCFEETGEVYDPSLDLDDTGMCLNCASRHSVSDPYGRGSYSAGGEMHRDDWSPRDKYRRKY